MMLQFVIKWATAALLSKAAEKVAVDVLLLTLNRWAASTETTWDDEVVAAIENALKD